MCGVAQVVRMLLLLFISLSVRIGGGGCRLIGGGGGRVSTPTRHTDKSWHTDKALAKKGPKRRFLVESSKTWQGGGGIHCNKISPACSIGSTRRLCRSRTLWKNLLVRFRYSARILDHCDSGNPASEEWGCESFWWEAECRMLEYL